MANELDTKLNVEKFAELLEGDIYEIKRFISFINADKSYKKELNKGISVLEKKLDNIKKSSTIKEVSKYIKIKKLNKKLGDIDDRRY
jgi:hypothetical protein